VQRGLKPQLAREVAVQLMAHDALGAHARDELGLSSTHRARPMQAAIASAVSFAAGAAWPLLLLLLAPSGISVPVIFVGSLLSLAVLGALARARRRCRHAQGHALRSDPVECAGDGVDLGHRLGRSAPIYCRHGHMCSAADHGRLN
jgi:hypothetical protein